MTDIFNSPALDTAVETSNEARLLVADARLKRLIVFINLVKAYLALEPDLSDLTDWHSNDAAMSDFADKIRNGESRDFRTN